MNLRVCNTQDSVYNHIRRSYIRPKEWEELCPICEGTGEEIKEHLCLRCLGKGTIDWISKAMKNE
jgi:DnaJ-class molecular chaperone